jgi:hypothetical protein
MILLFSTAGRLGNQLFHLAALDKLCHSRQIGVLFGSKDLRRHFHWQRPGVFISSRGGERVLRMLHTLSRQGLACHCTEGKVETEFGSIGNGELLSLNGSRSPLLIVEKAFLQSDAWMRDDFTHMLTFRRPIVQSVDRFAERNCIDWNTAIFVHVRRGDYLDVNILSAGSPTPPACYYRNGIQRLQGRMHVSVVIFVTDDAAWVHQEFAYVNQKIVVSQSAPFDLCVMSKCASGVMSPSSFSWWGAMLGPQRVAPVGPQYWLGWKRGIVYPAKIISSRFDPIPVE